MKKLNKTEIVKLYIKLIPKLTFVARKHGYALGVHGSLSRDLDIMLVPWTDWAEEPQAMLEEMEKEVAKEHGWVSWVEPKSLTKPHGREAYTLIFHDYKTTHPEWTKLFIDISITPVSKP